MGCPRRVDLAHTNRGQDVLKSLIGQRVHFSIGAILNGMRHKNHRRVKAQGACLGGCGFDKFG